jgi:hypothetical protein
MLNIGARWGWVVNARPRPLYPQQTDPVSAVQEDGWISWTVRASAENPAPPGFDPRNVQPVGVAIPTESSCIIYLNQSYGTDSYIINGAAM